MAWHELHTALFGAKIPPEMAQAWTGVWALAGYTDEILADAVLALARRPIGNRPQWPQEHIEELEAVSGQILIDRALAGQLGPEKLKLAAKLARENHEQAQAVAKRRCIGVYEWDPVRGMPEAKAALVAREKYEALKAAVVASGNSLEEKIKKTGNRIAARDSRDTNTPNIELGEILAGIGGMNSRGGGK